MGSGNNSLNKMTEGFFVAADERLMEKLRAEVQTANQAEAVRLATGLADVDLSMEIAKQGISLETLAAFRLVPLVAVAWGDNRVDDAERKIVLRAAEQTGIKAGQASFELLDQWLQSRPPETLFESWKQYAQVLSSSLTPTAREHLKAETVRNIQRVAEATGGFLGFATISKGENEIMKEIETALS